MIGKKLQYFFLKGYFQPQHSSKLNNVSYLYFVVNVAPELGIRIPEGRDK